MIALHIALVHARLCLWTELGMDNAEGSPSEGRHPRCGSPEGIKRAAASFGISLKSLPMEARVWLPSIGESPLPSSPLLGECVSSETPQLRSWSLSLLPLPIEALLPLSYAEGQTRLSTPGLFLAPDFKYLLEMLRFAVNLTARGSFLPGLENGEEGVSSVWQPLCLGEDKGRLSLFVRHLPPIFRYYETPSFDGKSPPGSDACCRQLLTHLQNQLVRLAYGKGRRKGSRIDPSNPHAVWVGTLGWPENKTDWGEALTPLLWEIRDWLRPLSDLDRSPWRLCLRLEEPTEECSEWCLLYLLQSVKNPGILIPAARLWDSSGAAETGLDEGNPKQILLRGLAQAASFVPAIADSLAAATPEKCVFSEEETVLFLEREASQLLELGIHVLMPHWWKRSGARSSLSLSANMEGMGEGGSRGLLNADGLKKIDWNLALDGEPLTAEEMEQLTHLKSPLVQLRGQWTWLTQENISEALNALNRITVGEGTNEALFALVGGEYREIPVERLNQEGSLARFLNALADKETPTQTPLPAGFAGALRPYQQRGYAWLTALANLNLGGCLADDMGLGKTIQTLVMLQYFYQEGQRHPSLLICPTSVIENWVREAARFVPKLPLFVHYGSRRLKGDAFAKALQGTALVISSYALLQRDIELYTTILWDGVILDEAQNIKNPGTRQARAARSLKSNWRIALTGTPIENHVGDLWSLMEFLNPGFLGKRERFQRRFLRAIQIEKDGAASARLRRLVSPFILRRLKTDKDIVPDLPDKIETAVYCGLKKEQATLYAAVVGELEAHLHEAKGIKRKGMVLAALTQLKQICDHPALFVKDSSHAAERSSKLERLLGLCEEMLQVGDKMLIFTQYVEMGHLLQRSLQETFGVEALFLHGGVPKERRDQMVARFQEEGAAGPPIFILSLKAGGTGLNLTGANHVVLYDRWWNPAVEQQAMDRAYRIGQKKNVQVHVFCCRGTLEEKVDALVQSKKAIAGSIIGSGERWLTELDDKELGELIALHKDAVDA